MTTLMHDNCDQCGYPGLLYVHENGDWLCDECTASADMRQEREAVYGQEGRRRGHDGYNEPRVDAATNDAIGRAL